MTINHHPSDETLLRHAAGTLGAGPAVVIAAHLEGCETCRRRISEFESLGGAILEGMPLEPLRVDALARALERLDLPSLSPRPETIVVRQHHPVGLELPSSLHHCDVGPWRWLGPGFRWSKVSLPGNSDAKVLLLKGRAGLKLPAHGHDGTEFLQVLSGSLFDERGRYYPGDLDEADTDVDHQPVISSDSECICLVALEGDTRLHSALGRLLWPIVGF